MRIAHGRLARHEVALASNQVKFSLIHREPLTNGLLDACKELRVALIAYGPFPKGVLSGKYGPDQRPSGMRGTRFTKSFFARVYPVLRLLCEIGEAHGKTPPQVAINWCVAKGTLSIPGRRSLLGAPECGALEWTMTPEEVADLDETAAPAAWAD